MYTIFSVVYGILSPWDETTGLHSPRIFQLVCVSCSVVSDSLQPHGL